MAHHYNSSAYGRLADRLNQFPQGAPATPLLFQILKMLFSEEEASLVSRLPIRPFTAAQAAVIWKKTEAESSRILEALASRAILVDMEQNGEQVYCLPPPMAGFFEFAFMRVRKDIDQKALAELFYQYVTVEEDFMRELMVRGDTKPGRVYPQEAALDPEGRLEILDHERASHVIETATAIGVSMCYCRHKKEHLGMACDAPMDICLTFNSAAHSLIKHGHARSVDKTECTDLLHQAWDASLVQFGENNREGVNFICNCCGCCCEALLAARRFGIVQTIHTTTVAELDTSRCVGCGRCVGVCPMDALSLEGGRMRSEASGHPVQAPGAADEPGTGDPAKFRPKACLDTERCLGCGVCVRACPTNALSLDKRPGRSITPLNTSHRLVLMATERGTLQNLIFDNQVLFSHRLFAGVLGAILRLPPVARSLAQKQLRSRYVEKLMEKF